MVTTKVFQEAYCEVLEGSNGIIYARWNGFLKPEQVKNGCAKITEHAKNNKITVHLSDHRNLKVLSKEVQEYLAKEWFPEVEKIGMRKIAALVAPDLFAKATVDKVNKDAHVGNLVIRTFESEDECIKWLLS